jgi:hypothetical protein
VIDSLSELVTCIITLLPISPEISTRIDGSFIVLQKRGSGKIVQTVTKLLTSSDPVQKEHYTINDNKTLSIISNKQVKKLLKEQTEEVVIQKVITVGY